MINTGGHYNQGTLEFKKKSWLGISRVLVLESEINWSTYNLMIYIDNKVLNKSVLGWHIIDMLLN